MLWKTLCAFAVIVIAPFAFAGESPFSTNDVSILLPLDGANIGKPKFVAHPGDRDWAIVSRAQFSAVLEGAGQEKVFLNEKIRDPRNWYLVGLRYAPCTFFAGATPACIEQLRFVYQAYGAVDRRGLEEYTMHVVYNFQEGSAPQKTSRLESFRALKNQFGHRTRNLPLAPNPVLESSDGAAYWDALRREVIGKYIRDREPTLITFMGLGHAVTEGMDADSDHWIFLQGQVSGQGKWSLVPLAVGAPAKSEHLSVDQDAMELRLVPDIARMNVLKETKNPMGLAFRIMDQKRTNDHNVSCVNCHFSDRVAFPLLFEDASARKLFAKESLAFWRGKPRMTELLIDNVNHSGKHAVEINPLRIFGYLDNDVHISQRAVLDSALAAEQANALLALKPEPQCPNEKNRLDLVMCVAGSPGPEPGVLQACFEKHCPQNPL